MSNYRLAIQKRYFFPENPFLFSYLAIFAHFLTKTDFLLPDHLF